MFGWPDKQPADRLADVRVQMDGIEELDVGKTPRENENRRTHLLHAVAEVLAAMPGDQHHAAVADRGVFLAPGAAVLALAGDGPQQGVDHRVAGHVDAFGGVPSRRRFSAARSVGAQCSAVTRLAMRRLSSSGQGA